MEAFRDLLEHQRRAIPADQPEMADIMEAIQFLKRAGEGKKYAPAE